jgi:hypothetical protein
MVVTQFSNEQPSNNALSPQEEKALVSYLLRMSANGYPLPVKFARSLAHVITGKNWPQAFYKRHLERWHWRVKRSTLTLSTTSRRLCSVFLCGVFLCGVFLCLERTTLTLPTMLGRSSNLGFIIDYGPELNSVLLEDALSRGFLESLALLGSVCSFHQAHEHPVG